MSLFIQKADNTVKCKKIAVIYPCSEESYKFVLKTIQTLQLRLKKYDVQYFIVKQNKQENEMLFNYGLLCNIGYTQIKTEVDSIIFCSDDVLKYSLDVLLTRPEGVHFFNTQVKNKLDSADYNFKTCAITPSTYKKIQGFSNEYVGLGFYNEFHEFLLNVQKYDVQLTCSMNVSIDTNFELHYFLTRGKPLKEYKTMFTLHKKDIIKIKKDIIVLPVEIPCLDIFYTLKRTVVKEIPVPSNLKKHATMSINIETETLPHINKEILSQYKKDNIIVKELQKYVYEEDFINLFYPYAFLDFQYVDMYQSKIMINNTRPLVALLSSNELQVSEYFRLSLTRMQKKEVSIARFNRFGALIITKSIMPFKNNTFKINLHGSYINTINYYFQHKGVKSKTTTFVLAETDTDKLNRKRIRNNPLIVKKDIYTPKSQRIVQNQVKQNYDIYILRMSKQYFKEYKHKLSRENPLYFAIFKYYFISQLIFALKTLNKDGSIMMEIPVADLDDCNYYDFLAYISSFFKKIIYVQQAHIMFYYRMKKIRVIFCEYKMMPQDKLEELDHLHKKLHSIEKSNNYVHVVNIKDEYQSPIFLKHFVSKLIDTSVYIKKWSKNISNIFNKYNKKISTIRINRRSRWFNILKLIKGAEQDDINKIYNILINYVIRTSFKYVNENKYKPSNFSRLRYSNMLKYKK